LPKELIADNEGGSDMPKMKSHSGASKRFKKTGKGKIKRSRAYHGHLLTTGKDRKQKNRLCSGTYVSKADHKKVMGLLAC
jgi:large subunit ribosomal protein L35